MSPNRTSIPRISGSKTLRAVALAVAVSVSPLAAPQFIGSEVSKPWTASPFKLNPKTRVKLDLRSASIDGVIAWFQNTTGITIVKDPSLVGPFPLTSAKAVPLTDAFQIFSTALGLKGYDLRKQENLLVIRKKDQGGGGGGGAIGFPGGNNGNNNDFGADNQTVLQVYPVTYANASQVARIVNSVFANSGSQNFGGFRFGSNQAGAVDVEAALQGRGGFGGGQQRGGFGQQGGNQQRGGFPGGFNRGGQQASLVQADYDDYSNQVIVNAPQRFQSQVRDLIKQLDKLTDDPTTTKIYHLQYANATEAVTTIQQVLSANVPRGKGGATTAQTSGPGGFLSALRGQTAGSGTATADIRSNNVVVTATPENIKIVDKIVQELDQNIPVESTTFVFPLNNAKADEVATLLQSAFGTRTGVNGGRTGGTTTAGRTSTTSNSNNNNRNNGGGQRLGAQVQGNDLALAMAPGSADELETSVGVTQGFGQNFLNQGRGGTNGAQTRTVGTNSAGQVVNTRDLSNQVTAIADTNTNSLIVVTSPENAAIIKAILDQLDKIPEQVLIETIIVEATLTASDKLGVEWSYTGGGNNRSNVVTDYNNVGATASTTNDNQGFRYTLTGTNYSVFVNALKSDSKFQVLSTPKIFTSNGVEAEINISQSLPYITSSIQNVNGTFTNNYQFTDVGIVLTVTPRITSNGMVAMDVQQTANDLQGYTSFNAPIINQRIANTRVSVKDGETIILGGIIRNAVTTDVRRIPVLGDIPLLGQLFRSNVKTKERTELLVFLTPHVVRDSDEARRLREEEERKISPETNKAFNDYLRKGNNEKNKTPERTVPPVTTPPAGGGTGTGTPPPAGGGNPR